MDNHKGYKVTAEGWIATIKIFSYALEIPALSDEVLRKMSYAEKMFMAKRLRKMIDLENPDQLKRGEYMTNILLYNNNG